MLLRGMKHRIAHRGYADPKELEHHRNVRYYRDVPIEEEANRDPGELSHPEPLHFHVECQDIVEVEYGWSVHACCQKCSDLEHRVEEHESSQNPAAAKAVERSMT